MPFGTRFKPASCLFLLLVPQAGLLAWSATRHSPGIDEVGHLAAGLHHWRTGRFDLYRVNPPLVRLVATAPLALSGVELPDVAVDPSPTARAEFDLGRRFVDKHAEQAFWYFTLARWTCIPFALLGTSVVFAWGTALYGRAGGLLSACLWVVCPNALANGQMITPDTGATALGLAACYLFWRWLSTPTWSASLCAGVVLGLAELSKTTWVLLAPLWVISWFVYRARKPDRAVAGWRTEALQMGTAFLLALYLLNAGYGFEGFGTRLGRFWFVSRALTAEGPSGQRANRFAGTAVADLPVPLPRNYVQGIDVQKRDFEAGFRSYLRGEWQTEGWWYYYFYALAVKAPLGTLLVFGLAALSCLLRAPVPCGWRDELVLLLPGATVLGFVSSQTGFNHHLRYVLPALPFLFIWAGRATAYRGRFLWCWAVAIGMGTGAAAVSSLAVYPHSMSYFNEAAGGPLRGPEHLVDSNVDWGQDLLYLRDWLKDHPEARPLGLAYFGFIDPRAAGIEFTLPPRGPVAPADLMPPRCEQFGPRPGWFAVSVSLLRGMHYPVADGAGRDEYVDGPWYGYFLRSRPVARAGYSIWIYHLDEVECDRIRAELGLPPLAPARPPVVAETTSAPRMNRVRAEVFPPPGLAIGHEQPNPRPAQRRPAPTLLARDRAPAPPRRPRPPASCSWTWPPRLRPKVNRISIRNAYFDRKKAIAWRMAEDTEVV